jgi:hypothetical protein
VTLESRTSRTRGARLVVASAALALLEGIGAGTAAAGPRAVSLSRAAIWQRLPDQTTDLTVVTASLDVGRSWSVFGRIGLVDDESTLEERASGFANPALGATFGFELARHVRLAFTLGSTIPVGSGGGDSPARPAALRAMLNGTDWGGPMFGPNHLDVYEGFALTWTPGRLTLRIRRTLHPALRVRGARTDVLGPRVIFTSSGLTAGCSLGRGISTMAELDETRFLNRPSFLGSDPSNRSDHYLVAGLEGDFGIGPSRRLQPAVLYAAAVDAPKNRRAFRLVEVDLRLSF